MTFDPASVRVFSFTSHRYDEAHGVAQLGYRFDDGPEMVETFRFRDAPKTLDSERRAALDRALRLLHLVAGVSYWKAAAPPEIAIQGELPNRETKQLLDKLYTAGLGEYAYKNQLDLRVDFPCDTESATTGSRALSGPTLARRTAVPLGGGKDSLVTVDALASAGEPLVGVVVGRAPSLLDVAARSGLPIVRIDRRLSSELAVLNQAGALNGHVPVTAILSFCFVVAAILYDFDTIAMSNERSANEGNLQWHGQTINHQYSKSIDFERQAARLIANDLVPGLRYLSFLRPLSELEIARRFARLARYHDVFRSCNQSYRLDPKRRAGNWCGNCPKCRFVFLALAPHMDRVELTRIFGADLLDDADQEAGFRALVGDGAPKPFECVGEIAESQAAFLQLRQRPQWQNARLVESIGDTVAAATGDDEDVIRNVLAWSDNHLLPPAYVEALHASS